MRSVPDVDAVHDVRISASIDRTVPPLSLAVNVSQQHTENKPQKKVLTQAGAYEDRKC